jgi:hypothetical protein
LLDAAVACHNFPLCSSVQSKVSFLCTNRAATDAGSVYITSEGYAVVGGLLLIFLGKGG